MTCPALSGLILIDKPKGLKSAEISLLVKKTLNAQVGHCGTLDPDVTGVLPVLVGKAVKLLEFLQEHDKEYICTMKLEKSLQTKELQKLFKEFTGDIYQKPPEKAAVARKIRRRKIYNIKLMSVKDSRVKLKIKCQHGTYIRSLVEDFGRVLGQKTKILDLRRTKVNDFHEKECVTLEEFQEKPQAVLLPLEEAVRSLPHAIVKNNAAKMLKHGTPLMAPGLIQINGTIDKETAVAVFNEQNTLVGIGNALYTGEKIESMKSGRIVNIKKVLI